MGPLAPGKNAVNQNPWYAYVMKLTAPCEALNAEKQPVRCEIGDEILIPIGAQLRNLALYATDEKRLFELRLEPGAQPPPGKMRTWDAAKGRVVERGDRFPLLSGKTSALMLPPGDASVADDSEIPF